MSVDVYFECLIKQDAPTHLRTRLPFFYERNDWDLFRNFLHGAHWSEIFNLPIESCTIEC